MGEELKGTVDTGDSGSYKPIAHDSSCPDKIMSDNTLPSIFKTQVWCSKLSIIPNEELDRLKAELYRLYLQAREFISGLRGYGDVNDVLVNYMKSKSVLTSGLSPTLIIQVANEAGRLFGFKVFEGVQSPLVIAIKGDDGMYVMKTNIFKIKFKKDEESPNMYNIYDVLPDCTPTDNGYACEFIGFVGWLKDVSDAFIVYDPITKSRLFMVKLREEKIASPTDTDIARILKSIPVSRNTTAIDAFLALVKSMRASYPVGFLYDDNADRIYWNPGLYDVQLPDIDGDVAHNELVRFLENAHKFADLFGNPRVVYEIMAFYIGNIFFAPYRLYMQNADTPSGIIYGSPWSNKTSTIVFMVKNLGLSNDKILELDLITTGSYVSKTLPRLLAFSTETTLPGAIDDVPLTDAMIEFMLDVGASTGIGATMIRASASGLGTRDKSPILRMPIFILNAKDELELYSQLSASIKRALGSSDARVDAVLVRRILPINMDDAKFLGSADARSWIAKQTPAKLLPVLNHVVKSVPITEWKVAMRQDVVELQGKFINELYFIYILLKYLIPTAIKLSESEFELYKEVLIDGIEEAIRRKESREGIVRRELELNISINDYVREARTLRSAIYDYLNAHGVRWKNLRELLEYFTMHPESGIIITTARKNVNEEISNVIKLICEPNSDGTYPSTLRDCSSYKYPLDSDTITYIDTLLDKRLVRVFINKRALDGRINTNTLLGKRPIGVNGTLRFVFGLSEFLQVLLFLDYPDEEPDEDDGKRNVAVAITNSKPTEEARKEETVGEAKPKSCEEACREKAIGPYAQIIYVQCMAQCRLGGENP
jgi:hypothetical protein